MLQDPFELMPLEEVEALEKYFRSKGLWLTKAKGRKILRQAAVNH